MPRRSVTLPLVLPPREPRTPAYQWLSRALRAAIGAGHLGPGHRLPATRDLARQYGLSRGTVVAAFEVLHADGYLEGRIGSGTRVSAALPAASRAAAAASSAASPSPRRRLSTAAARVTPFVLHGTASTRAFRANQPALDLFPASVWARVAAAAVRRASADLRLGCESLGYPPLRAAIADYLTVSRGVSCRPEQVAVVSGVQDALAVIAHLFVDPGDAVGLEDPGYTGAHRLFASAGARLAPIAIDADGAVVPARRRRLRLAYLTPAHQFPLGMAMTLARRLQWLAWARATGAVLVEDDYDSEFRYSGRPMAALQGLDHNGSVIFVGSLSKVLCPSLRVGYLVVPDDLVDRVAGWLSVSSRHVSPLLQAALADFMTEGHFARHLRRARDVYAARRGALLDGAARWLGGRLHVTPVEVGLQTVGYLTGGVSAEAVARAVAARDVEVRPLARYARTLPVREGLQMGFAAADEAEIARGVETLARAIDHSRT